jgi:hypothetical protein
VNRPSAIDYVTGHAASLALTGGAALFLAAAWAAEDPVRGHVHWLAPLIALFCARGCLRAMGRVRAYRAWQAYWNEARARAAGETPEPKRQAGPAKRSSSPRALRTRLVLGAGIAAMLWPWLSIHLSDTTDSSVQVVALPFAVLTIWLGLTLAWTILRWAFSPTPSAAERRAAREGRAADGAYIVTVCVPVPWNSPGPRQFTAGLPPYARALLARGATVT